MNAWLEFTQDLFKDPRRLVQKMKSKLPEGELSESEMLDIKNDLLNGRAAYVPKWLDLKEIAQHACPIPQSTYRNNINILHSIGVPQEIINRLCDGTLPADVRGVTTDAGPHVTLTMDLPQAFALVSKMDQYEARIEELELELEETGRL